MEIKITGTPNEIAALVLEIQGRRESRSDVASSVDGRTLGRNIVNHLYPQQLSKTCCTPSRLRTCETQSEERQ